MDSRQDTFEGQTGGRHVMFLFNDVVSLPAGVDIRVECIYGSGDCTLSLMTPIRCTKEMVE